MAIKNVNKSYLKFLSNNQRRRLHKSALQILVKVGVRVGSSDTCRMLGSAGARVCGDIVYINETMVQNAINTSPSIIKLYKSNGQESILLDGNNVYFGTGTDSLKYLDPENSSINQCTCQSARNMSILTDALPNIDFIDAVGMLSDIDCRLGSRFAFSIALANTSKTLNFCADTAKSYKDIIDLASDFAGSPEQLKEKPFLFGYSEPVTPLFHSEDSCNKLKICAEAGIPIVYMPYSMRGGTAPISLGGALAQSVAEVLSGLVIHQTYFPGAPFIMGCMPSIIDMKTTIGSYGAAEFHHGVLLASEMADYYNLCFYGTGGTNDATTFNFQSGAEAMMSFMSSLAGKIQLIHDVGTFFHNDIMSPEYLVLCDDMIESIKIFKQKVKFTQKDFNVDLIREIGSCGNYLTHEDTLKNFKQIRYSKYFTRESTFQAVDNKMREQLKKQTLKILKEHQPPNITDQQKNAIKEAETRWRKEIM